MERLIPIRFAMLKNGADPVSYEAISKSVNVANGTYKSAGIQFWTKKIDRLNTPTLANPNVSKYWYQVKSEFAQVFPGMPQNAWPDYHGPYLVKQWLTYVTQYFAPKEEITVYIHSMGGNSAAAAPWNGREILAGQMEPNNFTHELGHYFGLPHPRAVDGLPGPGKHPTTLAPHTLSDFWDLVYGEIYGQAPVFYNTKAEADACTPAAGCTLKPIVQGSNCTSVDYSNNRCDTNNPVYCPARLKCWITVPGRPLTDYYYTGSNALKGLSFPTGAPFEYGTSYPHAINPVGGWGPGDGSCAFQCSQYTSEVCVGGNCVAQHGGLNMPNQVSGALSQSQVRLVHEYLRYEYPVDVNGWPGRPAGKTAEDEAAQRTKLGRRVSDNPATKLDFNGDGRRDIAVWVPPTQFNQLGQFRILMSPSFNTLYIVNFGLLNDTPVPADYDGDGKTDVATFREGGPDGQDITNIGGYWTWCNSSGGLNCASVQEPISFGQRGEVPINGLDFDGDGKDDVAIYRPEINGGRWVWRRSSNLVNVAVDWFGGGSAIALPGKYTADNVPDLAVYDPTTAAWRIRTSESGYSGEVLTQFPSNYVGNHSSGGSGADTDLRSSAMPLRMMKNGRLVPSVWYPYTGAWNTRWNLASSTLTPCPWGAYYDVPISGLDWNNDSRSDYVTWRTTNNGTYGYVNYLYTSLETSCVGTQNAIAKTSWANARFRVFAVSDMTGDGRSDILQLDSELGVVRYYTSNSGYTTASPDYSLGTPYGVLL